MDGRIDAERMPVRTRRARALIVAAGTVGIGVLVAPGIASAAQPGAGTVTGVGLKPLGVQDGRLSMVAFVHRELGEAPSGVTARALRTSVAVSASSGGVTVRTVARHTDDLRGKGHAALRDLVPTVRFTRAQTRRLVAAGGAVTLRATGRQTLVAQKGGRVTRARSGAVTGVQTMASARTAQNLWSNGQKVVVGYMVPDDSSDTYTGGSFNGSVDHGCTKVTSGHPYYFQAWACTGDLGYYPQGTLANVDSQDSGDDITFGAGYNEHDQSVPQASCTLVNADIGQCQVTRTVQQGSQNQGTCMHYGDSNELTCEWAQYDYEAGITA